MRLLLVLPLLVMTALAGCASDEDPGGDGPVLEGCGFAREVCVLEEAHADHHCVAHDVRPRLFAPDDPAPGRPADPWRLGDHWDYALTVDGEVRPTTRLVYYDDQDLQGGRPQHYMVGTPDREEALEHAVFSVNPMLGRIHRSLYSPHEAGDHVDMFHFPLCQGSTWSTRFFGTELQMAAHRQPVGLPGGGTDPDGFRIEGTGSAAQIAIEYSPQVRWFTLVDFRGRDQSVRMALEAYGGGQKGGHHFLRGQDDEVIDLSVQTDDVRVQRMPGGDGPYDTLAVWIDAQRARGDGKLEVHVRGPDGTSRACVGFAGPTLLGETGCPSGPLLVEVPWVEGEWTVTTETLIIDQETQAGGEARVVSVYDRGGSV